MKPVGVQILRICNYFYAVYADIVKLVMCCFVSLSESLVVNMAHTHFTELFGVEPMNVL